MMIAVQYMLQVQFYTNHQLCAHTMNATHND